MPSIEIIFVNYVGLFDLSTTFIQSGIDFSYYAFINIKISEKFTKANKNKIYGEIESRQQISSC